MNKFIKDETFQENLKKSGCKAISTGKPSVEQISRMIFCSEIQALNKFKSYEKKW